MIFCKDCKHVESNDLGLVAYDAQCLHPDAPIKHTDIVTGIVTFEPRTARVMRTNERHWAPSLYDNGITWCDRDAALFEERP